MGFIDPNDFELVALGEAGALGGAYLVSEGLHLKPLAEFTPQQWETLVGTICGGYVSSLQNQQDHAQRALQKVTNYPPLGPGDYPSFNVNSDLPK